MKKLILLFLVSVFGYAQEGWEGWNGFPDPSKCVVVTISEITEQPAEIDTLIDGGFEYWVDANTLEYWSQTEPDHGIIIQLGGGFQRSGDYAAYLAITGGSSTIYPTIYQDVGVIPGQNYVVSFWTMAANNAASYQIINNANSEVLETATIVNGGSYAETQVEVTVPSGCTSIRILFKVIGSSEIFYLMIDDVSIEVAVSTEFPYNFPLTLS